MYKVIMKLFRMLGFLRSIYEFICDIGTYQRQYTVIQKTSGDDSSNNFIIKVLMDICPKKHSFKVTRCLIKELLQKDQSSDLQ